jgi:PAS domain S-box-containing protein
LWAAYKKPRAFTEIDRSFLSLVAGQTAVVVGNAHAFEAARRSSEQLGAILDSSADPILVVNDQETVVLVNPAAESTLGVKVEAVIGKLVGDVIDAAPLVGLLRQGKSDRRRGCRMAGAKGKTFASRVSDIAMIAGAGRACAYPARHYQLQDAPRNQSELSVQSPRFTVAVTYMHGYAP